MYYISRTTNSTRVFPLALTAAPVQSVEASFLAEVTELNIYVPAVVNVATVHSASGGVPPYVAITTSVKLHVKVAVTVLSSFF